MGFQSLLLLGQALGEAQASDPIRLIVGSTHLHDVTGRETLCASKATMLGACRSIPEEFSHVTCRSVDMEPPVSALDGGAVLAAFLRAEVAANAVDQVVALRGPHRWVQDFEAVGLGRDEGPTLLRDQGVYLITGGLGGIGLTLAEHLARTCRARLVLVGRSAFPDRAAWTGWLDTHDDADSTSRRLRKLLALEPAGAEVIVETADVTDAEAMRGVIERTTRRFGPLSGVVHAAGVAGGRLMQFHSPVEASGVIAPKARGALVLESLLEGQALDFILVCSSLTALLGVVGQADYSGANAFLDAFAIKASRGGAGRVVSVNWDTWREVGMAVNTVLPRDMEAHRAVSLARGIDPAEGVEATMRILRSGLSQVVVSTTDLDEVITAQVDDEAGDDSLGEEEARAVIAEELLARPSLASAFVEPRDDVEREVAGMWRSLFTVDAVGVDDNFFELGGHSLLAVQFISRLREIFQVELGARDLFDAPTVAGLAAIIAERRPRARLEEEHLADTLALVEELSAEEIEKLLSEQD
jgi:NAD(P)-dependent dehydrogenase (short-subunit alcohol dehydrogenase family)/acyl carrier protein